METGALLQLKELPEDASVVRLTQNRSVDVDMSAGEDSE